MSGKQYGCFFAVLILLLAFGLTGGAEGENYRTLKKGDTGEEVVRLKTAMYYLGYFTSLNVSDSFNDVMVTRVKLLQKNNGFSETGEADAELQRLVYSGNAVPAAGAPKPTAVPTATPEPTPSPAPLSREELLSSLLQEAETYPVLQEGDSGSAVLRLKKAMYYLGYFTSLNLTDAYNSVMAERVRRLQEKNGLEATGVADGLLQALVYSGQAVPDDNAPSPTRVPTPAPTVVAPQSSPELPETDEKGFLLNAEEEYLYADGEDGLWIYKSNSLSVEIRRYSDAPNRFVWFETEVYCSPDSPLETFLSEGKTPGKAYVSPLELAQNNQLVLAISDDFFGHRWRNNITVGIIIRGGQIIHNATYPANKPAFPNLEVLAVFQDGRMKTFLSNEYTAEEYLEMGVTDTFAFGPILVANGQLGPHMQDDGYYHYREPRCAVGMIEPYHYFILTVNGRGDYRGAYLNWLAQKMLENGVQEALNLDGGGTVVLLFMGERLSFAGSKTQRLVTSIIGFGHSEKGNEE